jgi:hypothetical protein
MKVILSYINKADVTIDLDLEFKTLIEVAAWVKKHHPNWTSYDVIVVREKEIANAQA